jgi:DNA-binding NarL/FixJ family response regulator
MTLRRTFGRRSQKRTNQATRGSAKPYTGGTVIDIDSGNRTVTAVHVRAPTGLTILSTGIAAALRSTPDVRLVTQLPSGSDIPETAPPVDVLIVEDDPALTPEDLLAAVSPPSRPMYTRARQPAGIALVMRDPDIERIVTYLRLGVRAFACHDAPLDDLMGAVRSTARGRVFLPHGIAIHLIEDILPHLPFFTAGTTSPLEQLTTREREVLSHVTAGRSNAEIADACHLSEKTIKFHVSNILRKLGVKNRLQAVAQAHQTLPHAA